MMTSTANPILRAFKDAGRNMDPHYLTDRLWHSRIRTEWSRWPGVTQKHIDHADKVLARWAALHV